VNEAKLNRRFNTKAELIRTALESELGNSPFGKLQGCDDPQTDIAKISKTYIETCEGFGSVVVTLTAEAAKHPEIRGAMSAMLSNRKAAIGGLGIVGWLASGRFCELLNCLSHLQPNSGFRPFYLIFSNFHWLSQTSHSLHRDEKCGCF